MLDFRQNSSRRTTAGRQTQRRLLVLILMLGIVLILMDGARNPSIRRGLGRLLSPPQGPGDATIDDPVIPAAQSKSPPGSLSIPPDEFDAVRDDTPSTRDELACSLRLLDILNRTDAETLGQASLGRVSYAQLFRQPSEYRGRLVTVSGVVRRASRLDLLPNQYELKQYYQVWLWPSDNPSAPMVVYCLRLPQGFPTGMELAEPAVVTGYFFKRWAYQANDALRAAPELLARTLHWEPQPVVTPPQPVETWPIPLVVGVAAVAALLATAIVYFRTRPTPPRLPDRPPYFDTLDKMDQQEPPANTHG